MRGSGNDSKGAKEQNSAPLISLQISKSNTYVATSRNHIKPPLGSSIQNQNRILTKEIPSDVYDDQQSKKSNPGKRGAKKKQCKKNVPKQETVRNK